MVAAAADDDCRVLIVDKERPDFLHCIINVNIRVNNESTRTTTIAAVGSTTPPLSVLKRLLLE